MKNDTAEFLSNILKTEEVPVFPQNLLDSLPYHRGTYTPKYIIVGEAAGGDEERDEKKRAFIGASGHLLDLMLKQAGIPAEEVYFTNVLKLRPDKKTFKEWFKNNKAVYYGYIKVLQGELKAVCQTANIIIPCGAVALKAICGKDSIDCWRGSIIQATLPGIEGFKCVPIIHPAAILRVFSQKIYTVIDLKRVKEEAKTKTIDLPKRNHIIRPTFEAVIQHLNRLIDSDLPVSVDIETLTTRPNRITSIQFTDSKNESITIPFQYRNGTSYWTVQQEVEIWKKIAILLTTLKKCGPRLIGHNFVRFDTFMLHFHGIPYQQILDNMLLDTMEAFQCLQPDLPKGLDFLTSTYTREPYYKSEGKEWDTKQGEDEFWTYGGKDVCVTHEIFPQLQEELKENKLEKFYAERFLGMAKSRMRMAVRGFKLDLKKREELTTQFQTDMVKEHCRITALVGEPLNVNSNKQMKDLLYGRMKLPVVYKHDKVTCDEDALLSLASKHPSDVFAHIIKMRGLRVLYSNNLLAKYDTDKRLRTSFGFTDTGRFVSSKTPLATGANLQNYTKDMRVFLIPDDDEYVFVQGDLSQAEARVVAWRGCLYSAIELFQAGKDIHKETAALIYKKVVSEINKLERYVAKKVRHALNYDMHPPRFAQVYNKDAAELGFPLISIQEAANLHTIFHQINPNLRNVYYKNIDQQIRKNKTLYNVHGRKCVFHDRIGPELSRQTYAWYAQSTIGDLTNIILQRAEKEFDTFNYTTPYPIGIWHQNHDAILVHCHKSLANYAARTLIKCSIIELDICPDKTIPPLIVPMDIELGRNWKDMKEYNDWKMAA